MLGAEFNEVAKALNAVTGSPSGSAQGYPSPMQTFQVHACSHFLSKFCGSANLVTCRILGCLCCLLTFFPTETRARARNKEKACLKKILRPFVVAYIEDCLARTCRTGQVRKRIADRVVGKGNGENLFPTMQNGNAARVSTQQ